MDRFKKYTMNDFPSECLMWTGSKTKAGYGRIALRENGVSKTVFAHRFIYICCKGQIPKSLCVLHSCDTPSCVNIEHLFLGTHKENTNDMCKKGRHRNGHLKLRGENHWKNKLSNEDIIKIKKMIKHGIMLKDIAKEYGVHPATITNIKLNKVRKYG